MTIEKANNWLLNEFSKFYLTDKLNLIIDSLSKENFIDTLTSFVNTNKTYAENEINQHNPDQAQILINELNNINYQFLQNTYCELYDQTNPIPNIVLEPSPEGTFATTWVNGEMNVLFEHSMNIFRGGLDPLSDKFNREKDFVLKSIQEIRSSLTNIENLVNGLVSNE